MGSLSNYGRPFHSSGNWSSAYCRGYLGSRPGHYIWDLWWISGTRINFSESTSLFLSINVVSMLPIHNHQFAVNAAVYILLPLLTYLLTPWCRVLLEKLTGLQLVKKFPAFHGT